MGNTASATPDSDSDSQFDIDGDSRDTITGIPHFITRPGGDRGSVSRDNEKNSLTTALLKAEVVNSQTAHEKIKSMSGENNYRMKFDLWAMRDIIYLALCWALTLTTSTLLTTIGPLSAEQLDASSSLSPFTIGIFLIGAAISSVPSGWLFRSYGRYGGFAVGCICQVLGSIQGCLAMYFELLGLLFIACLFVGFGQGIGQFYRFSAIEISPMQFKNQAVTYVLSGGILAAFLGPISAENTDTMVPPDYTGSFLMMAVIGLLNFGTLSFINFPAKIVVSKGVSDVRLKLEPKRRSTWTIISQRRFILSCTIATVAHTVMTMVMSNCSIAMNDRNLDFTDQSYVMMTHFLSMFSPGFVTGSLIAKQGPFIIAVIGTLIFAASSIVFLIGEELWNFYIGMSLLGIAWNLSFSAGTVMLTSCYFPHEATDVQAINDFILFSVAGCGSLLSGIIYTAYDWFAVIYLVSMMMLLNAIFFAIAHYTKPDPAPADNTKDILDSLLDGDANEEASSLARVRSLSVA